MDEARLRRAWRQHTASAPTTALSDALRGLDAEASAADRASGLVQLAENAAAADLARAVLALDSASRELSGQLAARRAPRPRPLRHWPWAAAASLALAAILMLPGDEAALPAAGSESVVVERVVEPDVDQGQIVAATFESPPAVPARRPEPDRVFGTGFDS